VWKVKIYGKDIDVKEFAKRHPGGSKVLRIWKDRDATEVFEAYHSSKAHKMLQGMIKKSEEADMNLESSKVHETPMGKAFQKLIDEMKADGLYQLGWFGYVDELFKVLLVTLPVIWGAWAIKTRTAPLLGLSLMAFGFYMGGWVSHDWLHHSLLKSVAWNDRIGRLLGFWQGYEEGWWKARHNTHHICTNEDGNDPDIRTAPLLTFIRNNPAIAKSLNAVQRWQSWYYLGAMGLMDMYWRYESLEFIFKKLPKMWPNLAGMAIHYSVLVWVFWGQLHLMWCMMFVRGFLTGTVVFATHYGEDVLEGDHNLTLVEQTSKTSRNIKGGYMMNVLTGYISLQTEHHLFPMIPTSNLEKVQPRVRAFFKEWGLEYREDNIFECVKLCMAALDDKSLPHFADLFH